MSRENRLSKVELTYKDEKGRPVSNFIPEVLERIEVKDAGSIEKHIRIKLSFSDNRSHIHTVLEEEIGKKEWSELDVECIVLNSRGTAEYLWNIVRSNLATAPIRTVHRFSGLGIRKTESEIFFLAGDHIISSATSNDLESNIIWKKSRFRLDIETQLAKQEMFEGMWELIELSSEVGRVLVAHVISGFVREAFKNAGFTPCSVLMIVGKSGLLKSSYVPHLTQLYNRNDDIKAETRFNSSGRFIEDVLCEYRECTAVLDDLHTAESGRIKKNNETTAEEIIRRIGDDMGRGRKEGNDLIQKRFSGNVVFIGEYLVGRASTIPRALVVNLTERPDGRILDVYQRQKPLLVSTFYYYFLQWYVENFESVCEIINRMLTEFRQESMEKQVHGRLRDTLFYLRTAYIFLLEFCCDSNFMSDEQAKKEIIFFNDQITSLIQEQQARFEVDEEVDYIDYAKIFRKLYKNHVFRLAHSIENFDEKKHDGLIHYDCLCLRGKSLDRELRRRGYQFDRDKVIRGLLEKNALKLVKNKHTVQIRGLRFYAIRLDFLDK